MCLKAMDKIERDAAYFERRAAEEAAAAERAEDDRARQTHMELARRYAAAAQGEGEAPLDDDQPFGPSPLLSPEFRILP